MMLAHPDVAIQKGFRQSEASLNLCGALPLSHDLSNNWCTACCVHISPGATATSAQTCDFLQAVCNDLLIHTRDIALNTLTLFDRSHFYM
jgi:hypothetical protein